MRIFFIGDIIGKPGRRIVKQLLPRLRQEWDVEFCIANGENIAGGAGMTARTVGEVFDAGVDLLTGGNHVWDNKEIFDIIEDPRILRPANIPKGAPGRGAGVFRTTAGENLTVINLLGRVFMPMMDCPFQTAISLLSADPEQSRAVLVDFHAEATSEKQAMGHYLDGRVSAVIGTHTHVPTADAALLKGGTAYLTDVGMTGPYDGVIGVRKELALRRMVQRLPVKYQCATDQIRLCAALIDIDSATGRAQSIRLVQEEM
ncbi:MAG: TIGR00282 family metallophosphoesterase [Candidatus Eisenbacteria bacterium]|uniref:TIGR00282 family metallophosphoesterase n=1 Tax=Eiseniibacteriota bacterium TaxID=2212470 RepID=A0A948RTQ2_UNCEI|nr:TIGR00282 family metallophosphoesterase [Candidatus Eisenbacteria bacterium]MBU1949618.1 TIGR00282 family metallophosphoesterase [Candidatus Eisenbacteria bacterium]MBU2690366.1 TIGR00282 family metallophosphoesterase [Candidatus Eisenbacteria bacterium]